MTARDLWIWDVATGKEDWHCRTHFWGTHDVEFTGDSKTVLAAGCGIGGIQCYDVATQAARPSIDAYAWSGWSPKLKFSPDHRILFHTNTESNDVRRWNAQTWKEQRPPSRHVGLVSVVAMTPDGRWVASGSSDRTIKIWMLPMATA